VQRSNLSEWTSLSFTRTCYTHTSTYIYIYKYIVRNVCRMKKHTVIIYFIRCHRDSGTFVPRWRLQMVGERKQSHCSLVGGSYGILFLYTPYKGGSHTHTHIYIYYIDIPIGYTLASRVNSLILFLLKGTGVTSLMRPRSTVGEGVHG